MFDDIGSYPLSEGMTREWVTQAVNSNDAVFLDIIRDAMRQKIGTGVEVPTYPQFQDMNQQFLRLINDETCAEEPLLVKKEKARIIELDAIEKVGEEYYKKNGRKLEIRICVTGPVELYLKQFGSTSYGDVLNALAASIDRFISNSIENAQQIRIAAVSIDEPSIGINPQIMFNEAEIAGALEKATKSVNNIDTQIHLHSPLLYRLVSSVKSIGIIGVESAANPSYLDLIDKKDLEDYDKFLRVGVARTDIFNMASVLNEKYGTNVWKEPSRLAEITTEMETPETIAKRLEKAYRIFGERIKYAGPDCGLGSWPTQRLAFKLLRNTSEGIKKFKGNLK